MRAKDLEGYGPVGSNGSALVGSDVDLMRDVYMTRAQREAYDRIAKDAARYEFLRHETGDDLDAPYVCGVHGEPMGGEGWLTGELLDEAVDKAMQGANVPVKPGRGATSA